jgi:hypothetical protein
MAKPSKDDFLMQAIDTAVDLAVQSTERIADLLPADLFAAPVTPQQQMGNMQQASNPIQNWMDSYNDTEPDFEEVGI